jgi:hypothetical protein
MEFALSSGQNLQMIWDDSELQMPSNAVNDVGAFQRNSVMYDLATIEARFACKCRWIQGQAAV